MVYVSYTIELTKDVVGAASAHWHQAVQALCTEHSPPHYRQAGLGVEGCALGGGGAHPPHSGSQLPDTRGARTHTQRPVPRTLGECVSVTVHHPDRGARIQRCTHIQEDGEQRHGRVFFIMLCYTREASRAMYSAVSIKNEGACACCRGTRSAPACD